MTLPFPPAQLNPNSRLHWSKKDKYRKSMKELGWFEGRKCKMPFQNHTIGLKIDFYPPNHMDLDNALASCKSLLDGVALGMGIDDRQFRPLILDMPHIDAGNPRVEVEIIF